MVSQFPKEHSYVYSEQSRSFTQLKKILIQPNWSKLKLSRKNAET